MRALHLICMMPPDRICRPLGRAHNAEGEGPVNYTERLRRLAFNDDALADDLPSALTRLGLDAKTLALARVAALVAMGAPEASFASQVDAAISAGATASDVVDVVEGVVVVVGLPRAVAAAPKIAIVLGHDLYDDEDTGRATGAARA